MKRMIILIGVPSDLGANEKGSRLAPDKIREFLIPELKRNKVEFVDLGNVDIPKQKRATNYKAKHFLEIQRVCSNYSQLHKNIFTNDALLIVLGGDHSMTFCHVKELAAEKKIGLIWLDAHGDFNTEKTSISTNIHGMVLNKISGKTLDTLLDLKKSAIKEQNISLLGVRDLDPSEKTMLEQTKIMTVPIKEFNKNIETVIKKALTRANNKTEGYHVSVDLDVVDPKYAPGVSTAVKGGLTKTQLYKIVDLVNSKKLISIDFVEVNPKHDKKDKTVKLVASCILRLCK